MSGERYFNVNGSLDIRERAATNYILLDLVEAVRALKPAPALSLHDPDFYAKLAALKPAAATNVEHLNTALDTLASRREELDFQCKVQLAEIERLQAKVADDALTIGALRDEAGRATVEIGSLSAELNRERDSSSKLLVENEQLKENASATLYHQCLRLKAENADLDAALDAVLENHAHCYDLLAVKAVRP